MLLERLEKVTRIGNERWKARCPAHEDNTPSLAIQKEKDGRILIHCFAGCAPYQVLDAVGLSLGDLFPDGAINHRMKGWEQIKGENEKRKQKKKEDELSRDRIYLLLCDSKRKQGERLSNSELKKEREAYLRVHEENQ